MTMRLIIKLLILLSILVLFVANIQGLTEVWPNNGIKINNFFDSSFVRAFDADGQGGVIVGWRNKSGSQSSKLYLQRIDKAGNILWGDNGLKLAQGLVDSGKTNDFVGSLRILPSGDGGAYVAYSFGQTQYFGTVAEPASLSVRLSKISPTGDFLWGSEGKKVTTSYNDQKLREIIYNQGSFIVVWEEESNLWIQKLSPDGNRMWGEKGIKINSMKSSMGFKIFSDSQGGSIIFWSKTDDQGNSSLFMQKIDPNGQIMFSDQPKLVDSFSTTWGWIPYSVSEVNPDELIVSWIRPFNNVAKIFVSKYSANGEQVWKTSYGYSEPFDSYFSLKTMADGSGGAYIILFHKKLYFNRVQNNGNLSNDSAIEIKGSWVYSVNLTQDISSNVIDRSGFFMSYTRSQGVYIQKVALDGFVKYGLNGMKIADYTGRPLPTQTSVLSDKQGGALVLMAERDNLRIKKFTDTESPQVKDLNVTDYVRGNFKISAKLTDTDSWIENKAFSLDNTSVITANSSTSSASLIGYLKKGVYEDRFSYKLDAKRMKNGTKHKIAFNLTDAAGNRLVYSKQFKIDNTKPKTFAPKPAKAKRNHRVKILWKVTDKYSGNKAYVTIKIKRGKRVVKTISSKKPFRINKLRYAVFRVRFKAGIYYFYVYAKDLAGNKQQKVSKNRLIVL